MDNSLWWVYLALHNLVNDDVVASADASDGADAVALLTEGDADVDADAAAALDDEYERAAETVVFRVGAARKIAHVAMDTVMSDGRDIMLLWWSRTVVSDDLIMGLW